MAYKVTLDPGHGGKDPGASANGLIEKEITLVVALRCKKELERHGVEVHMTRTTDIFVDLLPRANAANAANSQYYVSIHCNAGGGDRGEVIHSIHRGKGLELSNKISDELKAIGQSVVKIYDKVGDGNKDYYSVIRNTNMDAVIVECAFLDNAYDCQIIDTVPEQEAFGVAIAKGILKQLGLAYKSESGSSTNPTPSGEIYRVRKSWSDAASQIGAYSNLSNAKAICDKNPGYSVFNSKGEKVYSSAPQKIDVIYQVYTAGRWLSNVKNLTDYAGIYGNSVQAVYANLSSGSIRYRVHTISGRWLPWVVDRSDYAGIYGSSIDGIQFELVGLPNHSVRYRAYSAGRWLPYVTDLSDYAGIFGQTIQGLQVEVVSK